MRYILIITFLLCIVFCYAQQKDKNVEEKTNALIASKNNNIVSYKSGTPIRVKYLNGRANSAVQGSVFKVSTEGIYLLPFKKVDTTLKFIMVDSILSVKKLLRKQRAIIGAISAAAVIAFFIAFSNSNDNYLPVWFEALIIPVGVASYGSLVTFLIESVSENSIKKGWHFTIH